MNWTISYNGVEKLVADWGLTQLSRKLKTQGLDELSFKADGTLCDAAPIFAAYSTLTLWRDRTANSDGTFSGGTPWFTGLITQVPRAGAPNAESMMYKVAGPWWYLDKMVFHQPYQNIFLGYATPNDPTTNPIFAPGTSSHLFLNQGVSGSALTKINNGQQIVEALNWALKPFTDVSAAPPFQIGAVTPTVDVPIDEVRDITCAQVIRKMLRWSPDAVTWFDYTTTPPTFNCKRRSDMTAVNLDISGAGIVKDFNVNARYDLQVPSVQIFYEIATTVDSSSTLSLVTDSYPDPLPTDPIKQYMSLQFTVDLMGTQATNASATLVCEPIDVESPAWWVARHPQYSIFDPSDPSDAGNTIASFTIDPDSMDTSPNPATDTSGNPVADMDYPNELTSGQLAPWMKNFQSQRVTNTCTATITYRNGQVKKGVKFTYNCLSTNATSGTYTNSQVSQYPEPVPIGLAQYLYNSLSILQFEGGITLGEEEVSGSLLIGQLFNMTGGALAEWTTMNAMVQNVSENLDMGETTVQFGPPRNLSAGELVDLLRTTRNLLLLSSFNLRINGSL